MPTCDDTALLKCPYYTYVPCRLSLCGNCSLTCHVNNQDVDCGGSKTGTRLLFSKPFMIYKHVF